MTLRIIIGGLIVAMIASAAGFPFEPAEAHSWAGLFFVIFALALISSAILLAIESFRASDDLAVLGFVGVALYGAGTTLNGSLLARGELEISVGLQPGIWGALVVGFLFLALSGQFPAWVRMVGLLSAIGHAIAAVALLFGSEMPHTGAQATDAAPMIVAISKLLFWAVLIGWIATLWRRPSPETSPFGEERLRRA